MPADAPARPARLRPLVLTLSLILGLLVGPGALGAAAHAELIGSSPAEGDVVSEAPEEMRLTFNEDVQEIGLAVQLSGPEGEVEPSEAPRVEGPDVVAALPASLPNGDYTLTYRVTSADGHPIAGEIAFAMDVAGGSGDDAATDTAAPAEDATATQAPPAAGGDTGATTDDATTEDATTDDATTEDATNEDAATEDATNEAVAGDDAGATTEAAVAPAADDDAATGGSSAPLIIGIAAGVLVLAGLGLLIARRSGTSTGADA